MSDTTKSNTTSREAHEGSRSMRSSVTKLFKVKNRKKVNMKNQTYEQIVDRVNHELSKCTEFNFSTFRQIDKKFKLPAGSSYEISGWKDTLCSQKYAIE